MGNQGITLMGVSHEVSFITLVLGKVLIAH